MPKYCINEDKAYAAQSSDLYHFACKYAMNGNPPGVNPEIFQHNI